MRVKGVAFDDLLLGLNQIAAEKLELSFFINATVLMFRTSNVHFTKFHNYDSFISILFIQKMNEI